MKVPLRPVLTSITTPKISKIRDATPRSKSPIVVRKSMYEHLKREKRRLESAKISKTLKRVETKEKFSISSLCTINLVKIIEELDKTIKPNAAVTQVAKMLCIFVEVFRDRSVHFLTSAESLLTWPQILQFIRTHMKQAASTLT